MAPYLCTAAQCHVCTPNSIKKNFCHFHSFFHSINSGFGFVLFFFHFFWIFITLATTFLYLCVHKCAHTHTHTHCTQTCPKINWNKHMAKLVVVYILIQFAIKEFIFWPHCWFSWPFSGNDFRSQMKFFIIITIGRFRFRRRRRRHRINDLWRLILMKICPIYYHILHMWYR